MENVRSCVRFLPSWCRTLCPQYMSVLWLTLMEVALKSFTNSCVCGCIFPTSEFLSWANAWRTVRWWREEFSSHNLWPDWTDLGAHSHLDVAPCLIPPIRNLIPKLEWLDRQRRLLLGKSSFARSAYAWKLACVSCVFYRVCLLYVPAGACAPYDRPADKLGGLEEWRYMRASKAESYMNQLSAHGLLHFKGMGNYMYTWSSKNVKCGQPPLETLSYKLKIGRLVAWGCLWLTLNIASLTHWSWNGVSGAPRLQPMNTPVKQRVRSHKN